MDLFAEWDAEGGIPEGELPTGAMAAPATEKAKWDPRTTESMKRAELRS
jgi:hypothetical protein